MRGEARDHGLVLVHDLQRALARLGLVRRVGAVDLAARDERPDRRGNVVLVGAGADEVERPAVARRARAGEPGDIHLGQRLGHAGQRIDAKRLRDLVEQVVDAAGADAVEHRADVLGRVRDVGHSSQPPAAAAAS